MLIGYPTIVIMHFNICHALLLLVCSSTTKASWSGDMDDELYAGDEADTDGSSRIEDVPNPDIICRHFDGSSLKKEKETACSTATI